MFDRTYVLVLATALGLSIATGASALDTVNGVGVNGLSVNGLSVNGLSVNGLSVNGTEQSAEPRLKAIVLADGQILLIKESNKSAFLAPCSSRHSRSGSSLGAGSEL